MGKAKTPAEIEAAKIAKEEAAAAKALAKANKTSITVSHQGGERVFSKEIHGEDFEKNAKEFAKTNNGEIL